MRCPDPEQREWNESQNMTRIHPGLQTGGKLRTITTTRTNKKIMIERQGWVALPYPRADRTAVSQGKIRIHLSTESNNREPEQEQNQQKQRGRHEESQSTIIHLFLQREKRRKEDKSEKERNGNNNRR